MTSNGRRPPMEDNLKIWKVEYLSNQWSDLTQVWKWSYWDQLRVYKGIKGIKWRWNLKSGISQQPLVGSYSNLNLKLIWSTQIVHRYQTKMTSNVKQPPTEDDLKIWKVEYLSIHWSDLTQIWNCSYWDQIRLYTGINWGCLKRKKTSNGRQPQYMKSRISQQPQLRSYSNLKLKPIGSNQSVQRYQMKMTYNGRQSPLEDNLKIWKVEYINNHWSYQTRVH
jgi:hypothetical protein